ncbi:hypothetical protein BCT65_006265 [Vibrio splendidus]|uniref:hypothetical protein n=1 Tax=Vibrio splendidus TaxID=29497 RepID=UPI000C83F396|nr:hypothetical protein [Vibrio splendidus]MCC5516666.1 hypothetical protein [Vibrio splendidus]
MTVTYQVLNISDGGGSENLLINPRGKINQANESDGVLSAGQYFCDGWKAGAAGAEVYRDADGFRLISGSILQLVPNNLDAGRPIKGNLDVISGTPAVRINGGTDSESSDAQTYITFEVVGNNSKFTRLILAESEDLPIYQQSGDELVSCKRFYERLGEVSLVVSLSSNPTNSEYWGCVSAGRDLVAPVAMSLSYTGQLHKSGVYFDDVSSMSAQYFDGVVRVIIQSAGNEGAPSAEMRELNIILDARL